MEIGYKVFHSDWTCCDKQYTCPGRFEEAVFPKVCYSGMHFCKRLIDCFYYYDFSPANKVAEVIAYGTVLTDGKKSCTNKLMIVRELSWKEVLNAVNFGERNTGMWNVGDCNSGGSNIGDYNEGNCNVGIKNLGNNNTGSRNIGNKNTGDNNFGDWNTGNGNHGQYNTGSFNEGFRNTGQYNIGCCNTGDFNITHNSTGCFNTKEETIRMFDKDSGITFHAWRYSNAYRILRNMPTDSTKWVSDTETNVANFRNITPAGYLDAIPVDGKDRQDWWNRLHTWDKDAVMSLPNFDPDIFEKCTHIDTKEDFKKFQEERAQCPDNKE